jgi:membrane-bound lytic murein transglycosylase C
MIPTGEMLAVLTKDLNTVSATLGSDKIPREHYQVSFKLVPNFIKLRAAKLRPIVEIWAQKYNLDPAFILAIIRQESSFNPKARSPVGAIRLMQIMPQFAGAEVLKAVTGKNTLPNTSTLYNPTQNIMFGTTYLQLLRDEYFPGTKDNEKRMYLMTASYNWGPHRIKTAIKKGRLSTTVSSGEIFSRLQQIAPLETQEYLRKVKAYTEGFRGKN